MQQDNARISREKIRFCIKQRRICLFIIWYPEIIQVLLEFVLRGQAGIAQITALGLPFFQAAIIKHFNIVLKDERYDGIPQTFLEKKQSSNPAVSVRRYHIETPQENDS